MPITSATCFLSPSFFTLSCCFSGLVSFLHHHCHLPGYKLVQGCSGSWEHLFYFILLWLFLCACLFFFKDLMVCVATSINMAECMPACQSNSTMWVNVFDRFPMRQHWIKWVLAFLEMCFNPHVKFILVVLLRAIYPHWAHLYTNSCNYLVSQLGGSSALYNIRQIKDRVWIMCSYLPSENIISVILLCHYYIFIHTSL